MENVLWIIVVTVLLYFAFRACRKLVIARREKIIDGFQFPSVITAKVIERYPHLSEQQAGQVMRGLREYFHVCNIAGSRMVSMPSQVVDVAWHEFILFTRNYERFCDKALGRFLHHTPAEAMSSPTVAQQGIKRAWRISCFREKIEARSPHRLPVLFAIDTELDIPDGFRYTLNCRMTGGTAYCAGHIACGSGCGGGCGGSSGCGGGCGGGD